MKLKSLRGNSAFRLVSVRFNSNITDAQLKEFFAPARIDRIERGSWMSDVYVYSDEASETLGKKLETWYAMRREEENDRLEAEGVAIYKAFAEKYCNGIGTPAIMTRRGQSTLNGHWCIDLETGKGYFEFPEDDASADI
jgi:hypothetical protein